MIKRHQRRTGEGIGTTKLVAPIPQRCIQRRQCYHCLRVLFHGFSSIYKPKKKEKKKQFSLRKVAKKERENFGQMQNWGLIITHSHLDRVINSLLCACASLSKSTVSSREPAMPRQSKVLGFSYLGAVQEE